MVPGVIVGVFIATQVACGDDGGRPSPGTTKALVTTRSTVLPSIGTSVGKLSRAESCRQFVSITADFRLTDQQSAVAYTNLARQTADPTLAAAIQRVADGFASNAASISSAEVQALCR